MGALFVGVVGFAVWKSGSGSSKGNPSGTAESTASSANSAAAHPSAKPPGADPATIEALLDTPPLVGSPEESDAGGPLPANAPKAVRFGVALVQWKGAQGAAPDARSKDEAFKLARTLADTAKTDFKEAVRRGDPGSTDDAGRMPRGILEPSLEYQLFTLTAGSVAGPLETPRGFWIVRRID